MLFYFEQRSGAGCMYSEKSRVCDILPNLVVYLNRSHKDFSLCLDTRLMYCRIMWKTRSDLPFYLSTCPPLTAVPDTTTNSTWKNGTKFALTLRSAVRICKRLFSKGLANTPQLHWHQENRINPHSHPPLLVHVKKKKINLWERVAVHKHWLVAELFICCCIMLNDATWRSYEAVLKLDFAIVLIWPYVCAILTGHTMSEMCSSLPPTLCRLINMKQPLISKLGIMGLADKKSIYSPVHHF